jgi:Na+/citrate or Na+/malate symporter
MRSVEIHGLTGTIVTTLLAVIGAAVVTILAGLANGRRIYASQL